VSINAIGGVTQAHPFDSGPSLYPDDRCFFFFGGQVNELDPYRTVSSQQHIYVFEILFYYLNLDRKLEFLHPESTDVGPKGRCVTFYPMSFRL
jgi:hypothetical protein